MPGRVVRCPRCDARNRVPQGKYLPRAMKHGVFAMVGSTRRDPDGAAGGRAPTWPGEAGWSDQGAPDLSGGHGHIAALPGKVAAKLEPAPPPPEPELVRTQLAVIDDILDLLDD